MKINDNDKAYLEALHDAEDHAGATPPSRRSSPTSRPRACTTSSVVIVVSDHGDRIFRARQRRPRRHRVPGAHARSPDHPRARPPARGSRRRRRRRDHRRVRRRSSRSRGSSPRPIVEGTSLVPLVFRRGGRGAPRAALTVDGQVSRGLKERGAIASSTTAPGQRRAVRRVRGSSRAEERRRRSSDRAAPDARRAELAVRVRGRAGTSRRWGTAANVTERLLRRRRPSRPPRRRGEVRRAQ